ncbi:hypothetical protein R1flu_009862 [Riccia fluitans]|uniref:Peptidase C14 caspase domain-containing protein n=1 Tax=Riccia fluitans TaxID=41844 RepID=A0ABD1Z442_9MARC
MAKRALLVGCNYPGSDSELGGCVNDVTNMRQTLIDVYGFDASNIVFMIDTDPDAGIYFPTGKNILQCLTELIEVSEEGDVLVFYFSGHGGQIPAESGDQEDDGQDECIFSTDMNQLTDDSFRVILANLRSGVTFTYVSDSCCSGGMLDSAELQVGIGETNDVGDETELTENDLEALSTDAPQAGKRISLDSLMQSLANASGHDVTLGTIRTTMYEVFKEDASPTVKVYIRNMLERLQSTPPEEWAELYGENGVAALQHLQQIWDDENIDNDEFFAAALNVSGPLNFNGHANAKPDGETLPAEMGILISGCESDQTSADLGTGGALSIAIQTVIAAHGGRISNAQLVNQVRQIMVKKELEQRPCLYCSEDKVDANFICEV